MATSRVRSPSPVRALSVGLALAIALLGLAGVTAPTAHADGIDSQFLSAAQSKGINFATPQAAIMAGHQVCNELDSGRQKPDVANDVSSTTNLDGYHAGFFVGLSIAAYCPRHHSG